MTINRQAQMAQRIEKQLAIDEQYVEPLWSKSVDVVMLEMCLSNNPNPAPVALLPELRFKTLLKKLIECFPSLGKIMVVDDTNARFDMLKKIAENSKIHLYCSAQDICALNYADNIFHFALTEMGLPSLARLDVILSSYRRVLRPDAFLTMSAPITGAFCAFFDILEEALWRLYPNECHDIMDELRLCMDSDYIGESIAKAGFHTTGRETLSFDIAFPDVEHLLFSTLVESHFLGICLGLRRLDINPKALLTLVVRAFHHYFQNERLTIPMKLEIFNAKK